MFSVFIFVLGVIIGIFIGGYIVYDDYEDRDY